jgi:hypothetical protein
MQYSFTQYDHSSNATTAPYFIETAIIPTARDELHKQKLVEGPNRLGDYLLGFRV